MDNLIRSFANTLDLYTKLSMRCWNATPEQCKETMTMKFPLIQTTKIQHAIEKIGKLPSDSKKASNEIIKYQQIYTFNNNLISCPTCGGACVIYSADEGTNSFDPIFPFRKKEEYSE